MIRMDYTYFLWTDLYGQGRLEQITSGSVGAPDSLQDLRYIYDANGNVLSIEDYKADNPQTQTFTYDGLDRLISGQATGGSGGTYPLQNYTYSSSTGNLSTRAGVSYTYGDSSHKHAVTQMGSDTYSYDANGNQVTRNVGGSSYDLDYDAENRLVEISGAAEENYMYDGDGNRVKSTGSTMNLAAGILPTGDVTINRAAVITDNDSLADNSTQYAYAATAGLHYVKIDLGAIYSVNKIKVWHYANDGRTYHNTKTQVSVNGTSWVTVYDSAVSGEYPETLQGKEITFTTQDVRYIRDYVNGNSVNTGDHWTEIEVWGYGTVSYVGNYFEWKGSTTTMVKYYYSGSNRVAMRRGTSSLYWLLGDHLGSQSITADATGGKISEARYYPWGGDRFYEYTSSTNYRFTGQRKEFGSGLYFYGARWYDSAAGRFIQPDTIIPSQNDTQSWDRYCYTLNNPIRYNDPSGHCPWCIVIGAVIGGAIGYGAQVYNNYQNDVANPWTTNISAEPIIGGAVAGATIGLGIGVASVLAGGGAATTTAATLINATGGDPSDEISTVSNTVQDFQGANQFWTNTTNFQGNLVYQRSDLINPSLTQNGLTNIQRMQQGLAPIGPDESSLQLHHMLQTASGPIAEVTRTFHQTYSSIIHINPNTVASGIDRMAFNVWRAEYWMNRANDFIAK